MKILVIALSGIGDALMFTPTLDKIKIEFPDAEIDVLAMFKGVTDIYSTLKEVHQVIHFDFMKAGISKSLSFVYKLRQQKYDVSVNVYPSNRKEYNVISWLIGAKKRLAAKYIRQDLVNFGFLNNVRVMESDETHNVETNFKLFSRLSNKHNIQIPQLKVALNKEHIEFAEQYFNEHNIKTDDIVIGFHSGCNTLKNHIKRRWNVEKFAELGKLLLEHYNCKILLFGAGGEVELNKQIANIINYDNITSPDNVIIVNTPTLMKSVSVMKRCNLFITNDSALLHLSSALKLNVIPIIGPTNINYIHPWQTNYKTASLNLECSPCFFYSTKPLMCTKSDTQYKCMEISSELVFELAKSMLGNV